MSHALFGWCCFYLVQPNMLERMKLIPRLIDAFALLLFGPRIPILAYARLLKAYNPIAMVQHIESMVLDLKHLRSYQSLESIRESSGIAAINAHHHIQIFQYRQRNG